MIVRGFKSVIWVATVGGAALSCYMVSLQVATERAELTKVERQIIAAKRDIRSLQTELGTRGRLSQLEQWNADVLALAAPASAQFLPNEVTLARFERTEPSLDERSAQVRMAALDKGEAPAKAPMVRALAPAPAPADGTAMVHRASFSTSVPKPQPLVAPARLKAAVASMEAPVAAKAVAKAPGKAPATAAVAAKAAPAKPAAPKAVVAKAEAKAPAIKSAAKADAKAPAVKSAAKAEPRIATAKAEPRTAAAKPAAKPAAATVRTSRIDTRLASQIKSGLGKGQGGRGN